MPPGLGIGKLVLVDGGGVDGLGTVGVRGHKGLVVEHDRVDLKVPSGVVAQVLEGHVEDVLMTQQLASCPTDNKGTKAQN